MNHFVWLIWLCLLSYSLLIPVNIFVYLHHVNLLIQLGRGSAESFKLPLTITDPGEESLRLTTEPLPPSVHHLQIWHTIGTETGKEHLLWKRVPLKRVVIIEIRYFKRIFSLQNAHFFIKLILYYLKVQFLKNIYNWAQLSTIFFIRNITKEFTKN